jgi:hypothetical protein
MARQKWVLFLLLRYISTRWRSLFEALRYSRKVAGSIPDSVIGIFNRHFPSGSTMVLGLSQPLTEMSTGNISLGGNVAGA